MQWIKDGETEGWLELKEGISGENFPGVDWNDVQLPKYTGMFQNTSI